jgi:hypothetical protein
VVHNSDALYSAKYKSLSIWESLFGFSPERRNTILHELVDENFVLAKADILDVYPEILDSVNSQVIRDSIIGMADKFADNGGKFILLNAQESALLKKIGIGGFIIKGRGVIVLSDYADARVLLHELGHALSSEERGVFGFGTITVKPSSKGYTILNPEGKVVAELNDAEWRFLEEVVVEVNAEIVHNLDQGIPNIALDKHFLKVYEEYSLAYSHFQGGVLSVRGNVFSQKKIIAKDIASTMALSMAVTGSSAVGGLIVINIYDNSKNPEKVVSFREYDRYVSER